MTPAERARLIDKQEFEAECRAVRERVLGQLDAKRIASSAHVQDAMMKPVRPGQFKQPFTVQPTDPPPMRQRGPFAPLHFVAGRSLTRRQWAAELGITYNNMNQAVHMHGSVEAVVRRRLGASANG
ncbi:hypothetical protein EN978_07230 [Mesorhizobium sp. M7A.F.Ca.US.001.04.1.1]|uniref:hypothetical protein n=1 Tax=unclassified Mesorhizobium TaxID=325217 RepID=UPI000FCAB96F|nr:MULTISPECIES: hypothetical protein [unclassified Mesorhizobium]RUY31694.1 hypothetical protein EN979_02050 [Mesorhizobium sp. M7A.F.Ca.US.001.04.2.1]RUY44118.1 hypothetical protein EN978_07230 [Mesorhizobium sp. M7A.F.Ca.US.001.04.1.1]